MNYVRTNKNYPKPHRASKEAAGYDLTAIDSHIENDIVTYDTGICVEIPNGFCGLVLPRSSIYKKDLILSNSIGLIDSDYRGSIKFKFRITGSNIYKIGERIGQLVIIPYMTFNMTEVDKLEETERGSGGHGSTGV